MAIAHCNQRMYIFTLKKAKAALKIHNAQLTKDCKKELSMPEYLDYLVTKEAEELSNGK